MSSCTQHQCGASLITNRVSLFGEALLRHDNLGAMLRASHFYDAAYLDSNDKAFRQVAGRAAAR